MNSNSSPLADPAAARAALENIEVRGPDADGYVWLVFHGIGAENQAVINLSVMSEGVVEVSKAFEWQRRRALGLPEAGSEPTGPRNELPPSEL
jgi:hypothetical protein